MTRCQHCQLKPCLGPVMWERLLSSLVAQSMEWGFFFLVFPRFDQEGLCHCWSAFGATQGLVWLNDLDGLSRGRMTFIPLFCALLLPITILRDGTQPYLLLLRTPA